MSKQDDALGPRTNIPALREREADKRADRIRRMDKETKMFHGLIPPASSLVNSGAGKGDHYRPVDQEKYRRNYDATFGKCKDHPKYKAKRPPRADCIVCRRLWREAQLEGSKD